jgi:hypothetical protein
MTAALAVIEIVIEQLLFNNFTILIYTCVALTWLLTGDCHGSKTNQGPAVDR